MTQSETVERGDVCVASVHFDPDSIWADVQTISDILESFGYGATMARNNSHLIVTRPNDFEPNTQMQK